MDFVSPIIIDPIVTSFIDPIKKRLCFLVSSTKYVKDMNKEMDQLKLTEQDVKDKKKIADSNNHVVSHHVPAWLEDVEKMKDKTENIPTGAIKWFNVAKRYKVGKQSYATLGQIKALIERNKCDIKWTNEQKSLAKVLSDVAPGSPDGTQFIFGSRDLIFKEALKSLEPNNETHNMIALCGMAGVGKTTMMEQLKKAVKDPKMFDWVVKVVIGENTDPISLQQAIAQYIGKDLTETNKDARADRLREKLVDMSEDGKKKILVIMDDIWKEVDLKDVGLSPLPKGFKLLLTSRFEYVCTQMGVKRDSIFNLRVLNDAEARSLFFGIAGPISEGDDPQLQKIGENIVKKCGGLPIAITTIAKSLSGNIKEAWQKALWRLEKDDLKDLESITYRIFEMSYENLKEDDDKAIFLLSALFPYDFDIHTEDLLRYGWGLNFFKDVKTLPIARRHMKICVNNLIRANLLTESDQMGCVKMHDLVRAFVLSNFSKVKQASIVNHDNMSALTKDTNKSYERILLKCTGMLEFPTDFIYPKLSLLILMDGNNLLNIREDIYERMKKLQVISYENLSITLLPRTFEHLTRLRTLSLHSCSLINDISFLGSLSNLEILSFANCNISWLPSTIGKLKKLKLLDLTGCVDLCIDDGVFQNLTSLEELYMRAYNGSPIRFTDANCDELETLSQRLFALELEFFENKAQPTNVSFKNLERFRISIGCELEYDENDSFRNTINLAIDCNEILECGINDMFQETEELHLLMNDMNYLEDVSMHHSFTNLRVLHVYKCANLRYLFTVPVASGFNKLERLVVSECPILKALVSENNVAGVIKFQKLNFMSLEDLPMMVSLCDNGIELPELLELILDCLPNFTSIYPDNSTSEVQSLLKKEVVIPKLEKLDISRMRNLKQIWPCQNYTTEISSVSMLRQIIVRECDSLVNLFPNNPFPLLNHLEDLEVHGCGSIRVLFNIDFESVFGIEGYVSRLRRIKVDDLGKLKEMWRIKGSNNSEILVNGFKAIERIEIERCYNFKNIFTPTTTNFDLRALTTYISYNTGKDLEEGDIENKSTNNSHQEINGMSEMDAYIPNATYPSYLLHACHHLQQLQLGDDERVQVVFDMDSPSIRELPTIRGARPPLLLPYLNVLELYQLKEMSHVWKCDWNNFIIPQRQPLEFPFQNLTDISLWNCHKIKYLFSPLMAKYVANLKWVNIDECDGIEEVISDRDDENGEITTSTSSYKNTTFFPHLDFLVLSNLSCLKRIDGGDIRRRSGQISSTIADTIHDQFQSAQVIIGACWSLCQYPRQISIDNCDTVSNLIPWYAARQMKRLEKLKIKFCKTMMEVFESDSINNDNNNAEEGNAALTSPTLKNNAIVVPQLSNLKIVCIIGCDILSHVFTFSTLESLKQLKELRVEKCYALQVIVKEESGTSSKVVVFPRIETLELDDLPNLEGFFLGMNNFRWPSLDNVMINDCPQLLVFTSDSIISKGMPCSFYNLVELSMRDRDVGTIIPFNALRQLQKLEEIQLKSCNSAEEVFAVGLQGGLSEIQNVVKIPNLRQVNLEWLDGLKYLWKSNQWMVLEFPNLTSVSIHLCNSLEHVFTCSMVGSLLQLQDLHISMCDNIEVIVKEEEDDADAKVDEIVLPRLKSIKLEYLSRFKGFWLGKEAFSLPSLDTLQINECLSIKVFTNGHLDTTKLKVIDTSFGSCYVRGDLNSFIKTKQEEGNQF
ncbi:putative AAA+ ATPase domain, P-loop containing nucleoside triphosphate hydrolase [Helianthus debilis subsp. tardiflorus]